MNGVVHPEKTLRKDDVEKPRCLELSSDLIRERKIGKNRIYSLNREKTLEMMKFFAGMWEYNLNSLKELLENEQKDE